jgi:hypothetical protein
MSVMATFEDVRRIALGLPEVQEKPHFGMPAFRVADKGFVSVAKDHSRVLLHLDAADVAAELALGDCQQLTRGNALLGLDADLAALDAARLERLLRCAWRHRAPKAVIRRHQA